MSAERGRLAPSLGFFWRIYLYGLALLVLEAGALIGVTYLLERGSEGELNVEKFLGQVKDAGPPLLGDAARLKKMLQGAPGGIVRASAVYRMDGSLVVSTQTPALPPLGAAQLAELKRDGHYVEHKGTFHGVRAVPLFEEKAPVAYLLLDMDVFGTVARWFATVVAALLATLALGSIPFAKIIAAPLSKLTQSVRALGAGDLSVRSSIHRRDEVGVLADAFNEMAERLEQLVRGEKALLANVSHELRTPLARIHFALEIAAEGDAARAQAALRDVGQDVAELQTLVEEVLAVARLDLASTAHAPGLPPLRAEKLEVQALVEQSASRFREGHPERALVVECVGDFPELQGDPVLLRRVLDNLLDNARKYSDDAIVLAARREEHQVAFEVRDSGIGIAAEDLQHLFTPFFRTDRSRARGTGGVGLGLALARRIVEAHQGTIEAESQPGQGTVIRVRVPAAGA